MAKILVIYYSASGNTKAMAVKVADGVKREKVDVDLKSVEAVKPEDLLNYDGIIIGSPTYYGTMSYQIKKLLDESVKFHGKLDGKIGAAFSSSANIAGGNETTVLDILNAMLIHGMIIQGDPKGDHYGPVAIGAPDGRSSSECERLGVRVAGLVKRIKE
ncbi:MAG: flavodoxin domain-containing protein [Candidatus Omnitrophica bacterium]|nr:flavodoxin domain-containing protein [Candidatus Omnitrophota bacterium]MDD5236734.1 flavodoxin domain-containing protein [Candidatus Omnitrophota bacterium]MDD5610295.1 flavodoxin domain-containing protein [Candidatus Omnitrophota bacterium]